MRLFPLAVFSLLAACTSEQYSCFISADQAMRTSASTSSQAPISGYPLLADTQSCIIPTGIVENYAPDAGATVVGTLTDQGDSFVLSLTGVEITEDHQRRLTLSAQIPEQAASPSPEAPWHSTSADLSIRMATGGPETVEEVRALPGTVDVIITDINRQSGTVSGYFDAEFDDYLSWNAYRGDLAAPVEIVGGQ